MTITLNGTTGITTPAETVTGTDVWSVGSTQIYKDTSGNVGIGTSSPTGRFSVTAAASQEYGAFDAPTSGYAFLRLRYNGTSYGNIGQGNAVVTGGAATDMGINATTNMLFATNGTTERMRIDSSGNLFVGTTSGNGKLTVSGTGPSGWVSNFVNSGTSAVASCVFSNGNGAVGSIQTSGSSTTYATSSDYRLKENIAPMTGALATVSALKPVTYTWKADGSASQGFIAHELQAVVPDCVTGEKDAVDADGKPVYQGIDTSFLVATLTAAIQEQQAIITEQSLALQDLKARIETLENK